MIFKSLGYLFSILNLIGASLLLEYGVLSTFGSQKWVLGIFCTMLLALITFFLFHKKKNKKDLQTFIDMYFITGTSFIFYYSVINLFAPVKFDRFEDFIAFFSISLSFILIAGIGTLFLKKAQ